MTIFVKNVDIKFILNLLLSLNNIELNNPLFLPGQSRKMHYYTKTASFPTYSPCPIIAILLGRSNTISVGYVFRQSTLFFRIQLHVVHQKGEQYILKQQIDHLFGSFHSPLSFLSFIRSWYIFNHSSVSLLNNPLFLPGQSSIEGA